MKSLREPCRLLLAANILIAWYPAAAHAQAVDYGSMEEIFGEPITTSVTGKPQRASEASGDLTIITQDNIRQSGADNIPDILQFVTGIDVRQYSFGNTEVGVRGYDAPLNPRLLVLVNGRQVYQDDEGYVAWNTIPVQLDEIRQIEILKGPNSALFGFNAASGVINIITYDPVVDSVDKATVRGGTQAYGAGDAVGTWHISKTAGVRVSVGGWTANNYSQPTGDTSRPSPRYVSFNLDGRWQVTPNIELRASGGYTDAHTERFTALGLALPTQSQLNFWRVGGAAETRLGTIDLDLYRNGAVYNYGNGPSENSEYVTKLTDLLKISTTNTIRAGLEYRNNSLIGNAYGGTVEYQNYAINGMWDWQISPILDLTSAVRLDHLVLHYDGNLVDLPGHMLENYNHAEITAPSFNSGLVLKASELDTVRLTAARGLRVPALFDFGAEVQLPPLLLGSPNLAPTAVWNAELAYDRTLVLLGATFTTAVFFQRNTGLIAPAGNSPFAFTSVGLLSQSATVGSSNEIGFEVGLKGKTKGGFRWNTSYRYDSITQDLNSAATADPNPYTNYADGTPKHEIILGGGYTIGKLEMDLQGRWQSSFTDYRFVPPLVEPVIVGNYVTFNARLGYRVTRYLMVAGTAEQFNLARQIESAGDYVERRFFASATFGF